jgi:hypothetical protein
VFCMYTHLFLYLCGTYGRDVHDLRNYLACSLMSMYCKVNKLILNIKSCTDLHTMIAQALFSPVQYVAFIGQHVVKSDEVHFNKTL